MHLQKPMLGTLLDWSNPLNKGCVMHLACNEGHGDVVRDLSMNGNHGALENMAFPSTAASGWNPGGAGVGLNFDATNDHINCGNNASLNFGTGDFSIFAWINSKSDSTYQVIMCKNVYNDDLSLRITNSNLLNFFVDGVQVLSSIPVGINAWHFVAAVRKAGIVKLYIDAAEVGSATLSGAIDNVHNLIIGVRGTTLTDFCFNGSIDQVRIHNRALTAKEVQDYYINPWQVYLDEEGM